MPGPERAAFTGMGMLFEIENFVPELKQLFSGYSFSEDTTVHVGIMGQGDPDRGTFELAPLNRHEVFLADDDKIWEWHVDSLSGLFRGDRQPVQPIADCGLYDDAFLILEWHVVSLSYAIGDRFDHEMQEIYSHLRRRPEGRSTGFTHDFMWQVAAFVLGTRPLSKAEFEAIMAWLERLCRSFASGPSSKNYVRHLRNLYTPEDDADDFEP
ncbi:MAG: hypothetical protein ACP5MD_08985 [Verrucomicrobiia bacterium]